MYLVCFGVGALNHARDFLARGWRPYAFAPAPVEVFWTALIGLDLAVMLLLLTGRRRTGVALAVAVMVADVAVNSDVAWRLGFGFGYALQLQSLFLGFVLGSSPLVWSAGLAGERTAPIRTR